MLSALILLIFAGLIAVWRLNLRDARAARAVEAGATFDPGALRSLDDVRGELPQTENEEAPILAIVGFDGAPDLSIERIAENLRKRWSYALALEEYPGAASLQRTLVLAKTRVSFEPVTGLDRDDLLQTALQRAGQRKSSVSATAAGATGLVVSTTTQLGALGRAVVLSQALLAVLETVKNASLIYWDPSQRLLSRRDALQRLQVDYENALPLDLWVSAHAERSDGRVRGFTRGLGSLDTSEFEALDAPENPQELEARLMGLARYAVLSCRTLFNGDTTGVDEFERIKLVKAPSETVHKGWVFQLHYLKSSQQPVATLTPRRAKVPAAPFFWGQRTSSGSSGELLPLVLHVVDENVLAELLR